MPKKFIKKADKSVLGPSYRTPRFNGSTFGKTQNPTNQVKSSPVIIRTRHKG